MASASRPNVRPRSAHRAVPSLTEEEINDELFTVHDEPDIEVSDSDEDYTQPQEDETTDSESEYVGATRVHKPTASPARKRSTPCRAQAHCSCLPLPDIDIIDESEAGESFSGFSDIESENSFAMPAGAKRSLVTSAGRPARRRRMEQHSDREEQIPSSSLPAPTVAQPASAPGPLIPRRVAAAASRKTAGTCVWSDGEDFVPEIPAFDRNVGITDIFPDTGEEMNEIEFFTAYFDQPLMEYIVQETNRYAADLIECDDVSDFSRLQRWKPTTVDELYVFFAMCMLMKHCVKHLIPDYWSKQNTVPTPLFGKYMARDRFLIILRCLHFANNADENLNDRLWRVRHVIKYLTEKFRDFYVPAQKLVIDESLVLFKGRAAFKQYIPSKRHRFGLKFFVLCDCESGMVLHMIMYSATNIDIPANDKHGFSGSVVKALLAAYLNKGHILYTDNYYTSPLLTKFLLDNKTGVCGTVKPKRKEMPVFDTAMQVGDCELRKCDGILAVRWKDRREVNMLTTIHSGTMLDSGKVNRITKQIVYKPDCVMDYNINMRLVDKCDMMVGAVECVRKTVKWTKKMFFHLVDIAMLNSYNMYLVKTGKRPHFRSFSFQVVKQILGKFGKDTPGIQRPITDPILHHAPTPRLAFREGFMLHQIKKLPPTGVRAAGQRRCIVCNTTKLRPQKRKLVLTWCESCAVPLCHIDCFAQYHSLEEY